MSQRYNTDNPVPSSVLTDLNDNLITIDEFVNNTSGEATNRKGESFPVLQVQVEARIDDRRPPGKRRIRRTCLGAIGRRGTWPAAPRPYRATQARERRMIGTL